MGFKEFASTVFSNAWFDPSAQRSRAVNNQLMETAAKEAETYAKGPSDAKVRDRATDDTSNAVAATNANLMATAPALMGAGTGAVSAGRANEFMGETTEAVAEAGTKASQGARESLTKDYNEKRLQAIATAAQIAQFNRKAAQADLDRLMDFGAGAIEMFAKTA